MSRTNFTRSIREITESQTQSMISNCKQIDLSAMNKPSKFNFKKREPEINIFEKIRNIQSSSSLSNTKMSTKVESITQNPKLVSSRLVKTSSKQPSPTKIEAKRSSNKFEPKQIESKVQEPIISQSFISKTIKQIRDILKKFTTLMHQFNKGLKQQSPTLKYQYESMLKEITKQLQLVSTEFQAYQHKHRVIEQKDEGKKVPLIASFDNLSEKIELFRQPRHPIHQSFCQISQASPRQKQGPLTERARPSRSLDMARSRVEVDRQFSVFNEVLNRIKLLQFE